MNEERSEERYHVVVRENTPVTASGESLVAGFAVPQFLWRFLWKIVVIVVVRQEEGFGG